MINLSGITSRPSNPIDGDFYVATCDICNKLDFRIYVNGSWISNPASGVNFIEFNKMTICQSENCKRKAKNKAFL